MPKQLPKSLKISKQGIQKSNQTTHEQITCFFSKREPKWSEREPKGAKKEPKGAKRAPKGAKRERKGDQNGSKNRLGRQGRFWKPFWNHLGSILGAILVQIPVKIRKKHHPEII